jgi:hypothetical protein
MNGRRSAGFALMLYLALDVVALIVLRSPVPAPRDGSVIAGGSPLWFLLDVVLAGRIWRGGTISWLALFMLSLLSLGTVALAQWPWNWPAAFLVLTFLIQAGILVIPPVWRLPRSTSAVTEQ